MTGRSPRKHYAAIASPLDYDTVDDGSDEYTSDEYSTASEDEDCIFDVCSSDEEVEKQRTDTATKDNSVVMGAKDVSVSSSQNSTEKYICSQPPPTTERNKNQEQVKDKKHPQKPNQTKYQIKNKHKRKDRREEITTIDEISSKKISSPRRRTKKYDKITGSSPRVSLDIDMDSLAAGVPFSIEASQEQKDPSRRERTRSEDQEPPRQTQTQIQGGKKLVSKLNLKLPLPQCSGVDTAVSQPPPSAVDGNGSASELICVYEDSAEILRGNVVKRQNNSTVEATRSIAGGSDINNSVEKVELSVAATKKSKGASKSKKDENYKPSPPPAAATTTTATATTKVYSSVAATKKSKGASKLKKDKNHEPPPVAATTTTATTKVESSVAATKKSKGTSKLKKDENHKPSPPPAAATTTTATATTKIHSSMAATKKSKGASKLKKDKNHEPPPAAATTTTATTKVESSVAATKKSKGTSKSNKDKNHKPPPAAATTTTATTKVESSMAVTKKSKGASKSNKNKNHEPPPAAATTTTTTTTKQPPPPKRKKLTFQAHVLTHLVTTMKPFTLRSLASELRTTDIALHHLMLSLLDKKIVRKKEFGKRNKEIYYVDLDIAIAKLASPDFPNTTTEEMQSAKVELRRCMAKEMGLQREMKVFLQELSNDDLEKRLGEEKVVVEKLTMRVMAAKRRLDGSRNGMMENVNKFGKRISAKDGNLTSKQIKVRCNYMRAEWRKRREKCNDFVDNLADAMEKKLKDVHKVLDMVTDQMEGVTMPPKQVIYA